MSRYVEGREQLVLGRQLGRARQRLDERRLAAVGVADDGDAGNMEPNSVLSEQGALLGHGDDLPLQLPFSPVQSRPLTLEERFSFAFGRIVFRDELDLVVAEKTGPKEVLVIRTQLNIVWSNSLLRDLISQ